MRPVKLVAVVAAALVGSTAGTDAPASFEYAVTDVKRVFVRVDDDAEHQLTTGEIVLSGHRLRTGARSSADLQVDELNAQFHLSAKTSCRLAKGTPGVLLEVDRGSARGSFGPLTDNRERLVVTPSAVLAVRGTEYGVSVDKKGTTTVTVFSGLVELRSHQPDIEAVQLRAGQASRIRREQPPAAPWAHGMTTRDWDRGRRPTPPGRATGQMQSPMDGRSPGAAGGPSSANQQPRGGSRRHGG
jgi:hypothetical protein